MTLHDEVFEQADVLARLYSQQMEEIRQIAKQIRQVNPAYAYLAGRGTSYTAGRYATYLWGSRNEFPVAFAPPSLFTLYHKPPRLNGALVVGISQSGQSPDIVSVLEEGRRQGCTTLAITNTPGSPLAKTADFVIDVLAGEEKAVSATKSYTAQLLAIAMLSVALNPSPEAESELQQIPAWVAKTLEMDAQIASMAERYRYMDRCVVIGRGYNYATACDWSLKIKEMTYIMIEPYSSADFYHGPIAAIDEGFPVLAIAGDGIVFDDMMTLLKRLKNEMKAELVVISDREEALQIADAPMKLPLGIPEWLSPLVSIIPAQLFAYYLTKAKGFDAENPRLIHKVTETR